MKLYGSPISPYVARVQLAVTLKGIDLPLAEPPGGLKSPEYLAMNPLGKMPTLEHDGRYLFESSVINEYLEDLYPAKPLLPADAVGRSRVRLVIRLLDLYIGAETSTLFRNMNPAQRDQAAVDAAKTKLVDYFKVLDSQLAADGFAAGPNLTLADCTLIPTLALLKKAVFPTFGIDDPTASLPRLKAWAARIKADPFLNKFTHDYVDGLVAFLQARAAAAKA